MKPLCCNKLLFLLLFVTLSLFGALDKKSAMVYYGDNISYPLAGIHDYIIVQPTKIDTKSVGFKTNAKRIYAYVSLGEVHPSETYINKIKDSWVIGQNSTWKTKVLDVSSVEYHDFILQSVLKDLHVKGFKNFFFDTLDSYQLASKSNAERKKYKEGLIELVHKIHLYYPTSKIVINRGFEMIDDIHSDVNAVLFESFHFGLDAKLNYKSVSKEDKAWLLTHIKRIQAYNLDVISVDYVDSKDMAKADEAIKEIEKYHMIAYVSNKELTYYGQSNKNALPRKILVLGEESLSHKHLSMPIEYLGYIPELRSINEALLDADAMQEYAGVIIYSQEKAKEPQTLYAWIKSLSDKGIKTLFLDNFASSLSMETLALHVEPNKDSRKNNISTVQSSLLMGYEIEPKVSYHASMFTPHSATSLFSYTNQHNQSSTLAAITPWGGYALDDSFLLHLDNRALWVVDIFALLQKALRLDSLIVADVTTQNGSRLFFNSIETKGKDELSESKEHMPSGVLFKKEIANRYNYTYTTTSNLRNSSNVALTDNSPWISALNPLAIDSNDSLHVYHCAKDENSYTNYFQEPLWGFKRVIETYELTNRPKRLKPIELNYHYYSLSRQASLNALKEVYNWIDKQDVMNIDEEIYIAMVKEFYTYSIAKDKNRYLVRGLETIKTLRVNESSKKINLERSAGVIGFNEHEEVNYLSLKKEEGYLLDFSPSREQNYLYRANGTLTEVVNNRYTFKANTPLKISFYLKQGCRLSSKPKLARHKKLGHITTLKYKSSKEATVYVNCQ